MRPVALDEIVAPDHYEALRADYRRAVIEHKQQRRLAVGEKVTLLFEDRETLRFQIQEMVCVERIADPVRIQHEIDVYNELVPGDNELSATLFIEITEMAEIRPELDRLIGIDEHVSLLLGPDPAPERVAADFDPKQMEEDRISAVQYIRFRLSPEQARRMADPEEPLRVRIDHPAYRREVEVRPELRRSLCATLAGEAPSLLAVPDAARLEPPPDELLFETARVRALRPARPRGRGHLIVEAREPGPSLLEADEALRDELLEALRRVTGQVIREHGRCRIQSDLGPEVERPRWHVHAPGR